MNVWLFHKTKFYKFNILLNIRDLFKDLIQIFRTLFFSTFCLIDVLRKMSIFYKLLSTTTNQNTFLNIFYVIGALLLLKYFAFNEKSQKILFSYLFSK